MNYQPFSYRYSGGSLNADDPTYVMRQADRDFYNGLKAGQFCYVLNSRQMGKSSLRVRTMARLSSPQSDIGGVKNIVGKRLGVESLCSPPGELLPDG